MGLANSLNKGGRFSFKIPDTHEYKSLKALYKEYGKEMVYTVRAVYINSKSKFGESPVIVTDNELVNFPKHMTDICREIRQTPEYITAINNCELGFQIYTYQKGTQTFYSVNWLDL